jgi:hypothetical protein
VERLCVLWPQEPSEPDTRAGRARPDRRDAGRDVVEGRESASSDVLPSVKRKLRCAVYTHGGQAMGSPNYRPRTPGTRAKPIPSTLIDRIGEAGWKLGIGIISMGLPHDGRQLKDLSPQVLHLRGQKQIPPIRHRQDGI